MAKAKALLIVAGMAWMVISAQSAKAGIVVGNCVAGTHYTTIQAAVNAAASGSTIKVCPAYYFEQVAIQTPLTLQGISSGTMDAPVIAPPTTGLVLTAIGTIDQVLVYNTSGVTLTNIAVDGSNSLLTCNAYGFTGIDFDNASGTVNRVSLRNQNLGAQAAYCTDRSVGLVASASFGQSESVTVENCDFRNSAFEAIYALGNITVNITNNFISGESNESGFHAGIYLLGATGTVKGNTVLNEIGVGNVFPDVLDGGRGISIGSSGVTVSGNTIGNAQVGIYLDNHATNNTILSNTIFNISSYDGIYVSGNNNIVKSNRIAGAGQSGVHLDTSRGGGLNNTISGNSIMDSCAGILSSPGAVNIVQGNSFSGVFLTTFSNAMCGPIF